MNSFDGAWHAVFGSALAGNGVVLLRNGTILGCDNQYFYEGTYKVAGDAAIEAWVKVSHYAGDRPVSIFGEFGSATLESYQAELDGTLRADGRLHLKCAMNGDPDRELAVMLTRMIPKPARKA
jgi:T3SS negative regulator,GrlR